MREEVLTMAFDEIWQKTQEGIPLRYGVVDGNDTIVLIKSGCGGSYDGYAHKYERMAQRIHAARGYSVITADNPENLDHSHQTDRAMIEQYANRRGFDRYTVCFAAHSDGWEQIIRAAKGMPQTARLLGINPSPIDDEAMMADLHALPQAEKTVVFGTQDNEFYLAAKLEAAGIPRLRIIPVEGADHDFTHRLEDFIALIDLL